MLGLIPAEVWLGLGGALAALVAWLGGKWSGTKEGRSEAATDSLKANIKAAQTAKDTRHEIETSDDQRLVDILSGKLHNGKR
jgi:hypothetical protein